jgi:hypothetical protein
MPLVNEIVVAGAFPLMTKPYDIRLKSRLAFQARRNLLSVPSWEDVFSRTTTYRRFRRYQRQHRNHVRFPYPLQTLPLMIFQTRKMTSPDHD